MTLLVEFGNSVLQTLRYKNDVRGICMIDRKRALTAFKEYISHYDATDGKIELKIVHTFRVNNLCEKIARNLGLSEEEVDLAWLIGLLHDIGRFEQIKDFGTFDDSVSVDHAKYGVKLLFPEAVQAVRELMDSGMEAYAADTVLRKDFPKSTAGKIRDFVEDSSLDQVIYDAINYHNVFRMPLDLDERTLLFCKIIRDADKIDILRVNVDFPIETIYNANPEEIRTDCISDEVMEQFYQKSCVKHSVKKTSLDRYVSHCSLVFELEFPISFHIVKEQGYLEKLLAFRNENEKTNRRIEEMTKFMMNFMDEKTKNQSDVKNTHDD